MNIVIVGCGKTGYTIARHLSSEENNIVIVDKRQLNHLTETLDVLVMQGNGISRRVLEEAGASSADMVISVMPGDEANVCCCVTAKLLGAKYTAARVSDPEYALELYGMRRELGINMILNPNQISALAISRLLRYPNANDIETFSHGYIELVAFHVKAGDSLDGLNIERIVAKYKTSVVFAIVNRRGAATIPRGDTVLQAEDLVSILGRPGQITDFFKQTKKAVAKVKDVMIIGGGTITYYLARLLARHSMSTKIIEISEERCNELSRALPDNLIINGDGSDLDLLHEEKIRRMDALVCLTGRDEENIVIGLYGQQLGIPKTVVKVNHINTVMAENLSLGNIISPKLLIADQIANYIRGLSNAQGRNIKAAFTVQGNGGCMINVLEFIVPLSARCIDIPLKELRIKRNVIIGNIVRKTKIMTPIGSTKIQAGDTVIIVTDEEGISDIDDIIVRGEDL